MSKVSAFYKHYYQRVEYPLERGYRWEVVDLPHTMKVSVTTEDDSKYLTVYSNLHVNKEVRMLPDYSTDFTDEEIIKDQSNNIYTRFIK